MCWRSGVKDALVRLHPGQSKDSQLLLHHTYKFYFDYLDESTTSKHYGNVPIPSSIKYGKQQPEIADAYMLPFSRVKLLGLLSALRNKE